MVNKLHRSNLKAVIAVAIMVLLSGFLVSLGEYRQAAFLALFWVIFAAILTVRMNQNIKKAWETNAVLKDSVICYKFRENCLEISSATGEQTVTYEKIYRLIETGTNFYIMIADNMGYIISKDACTQKQQEKIRSLGKICNVG